MNAARHNRLCPIALTVAVLTLGGIKVAPSVARAAAAGRVASVGRAAGVSTDPVTFDMVVSAGAKGCVPGAIGSVTITPYGPVEYMDVSVTGMPPDNEFDLFVIQVPNAPFGVSWYQGDIETDDYGNGSGEFVGRFSIETFAVAVGTAPAPVVHNGPFPDASLNLPFNPIHTYHLGLWFGSPDEAVAVGCPAAVTPFNGQHNAGIQILNTSNFPDTEGPLRQIQ